MTPAERQQLKRDRRKAGLVRVEVWVHQSQVRAIEVAVQKVMDQKAEAEVGYTGPITAGMEFIWEKDNPHAWARIVVTRVEKPTNDERRIWTKTLQGMSASPVGQETWNDESRFREAVTPLTLPNLDP